MNFDVLVMFDALLFDIYNNPNIGELILKINIWMEPFSVFLVQWNEYPNGKQNVKINIKYTLKTHIQDLSI